MQTDKEPPSSYETLLLERRERIIQISLNRPEKRNALNVQLQDDLSHALTMVGADESLEVLILTGQGNAFCAGLDMQDFPATLTHFQNRSHSQTIFQLLETLPIPVIGAINGPAITGGFELALCCDVLIASTNARFGDTHGQVGVMPGAGLSQKLSRIIGLPRAMSLSLTGEFMDGTSAHQCGLISHLVKPAELIALAWRMARNIISGDPKVIRKMKQVIKDGAAATLAEGMAMERMAHQEWATQMDLEQLISRKNKILAGNRNAPES